MYIIDIAIERREKREKCLQLSIIMHRIYICRYDDDGCYRKHLHNRLIYIMIMF